jgi:pilus assembly protein Flp/PilA
MEKLLSRFLADDSGATAIEYGLIGALISVAIVIGAGMVGVQVGGLFGGLGDKVTDAVGGMAE